MIVPVLLAALMAATGPGTDGMLRRSPQEVR